MYQYIWMIGLEFQRNSALIGEVMKELYVEDKEKSKTRIALMIWNYLVILCIITAFFTAVYNKSSGLVDNLFVLPIAYFISLCFARKTFRKQAGLSLIIIEVIMFCRFIMIPILYALTDNYSGVRISSRLSEAVWYMAYEEIAVGMIMHLWSSVAHKRSSLDQNVETEEKFVRPFTIVIILFWFFIIAVNSKLRGYLFNFSLLTRSEMGITGYITTQEYYSDIPGIYKVFFHIGLLVLFTVLVDLIARYVKTKWIKAFLLGLICIGFVSSMWTSGFSVSRWNMLIAVIVSAYALIRVFPNKTKAIVTIGVAGVLMVVIMGSVLKIISFGETNVKVSDATGKYFTAEYFDEYFEGITPVANGMVAAEQYDNERGLAGILVDCFYNFPYAMKFLGLSNFKTATSYFQSSVGRADFVIPVITESVMQFGKVFSPLYSCILVWLALWVDLKRSLSKTMYRRLFYTVIVFWLSLFMAVSTNVIEANIWYAVIGIWIITLEEKFRFRSSNRLR